MSKYKTKAQQRNKIRKSSFPLWGWLLMAAVVAGAVWLVTSNISQQAEKTLPSTISVGQAGDLYAEGAFFLDVREPSEWEAGHIPGATLIPLGELESRVNEVPKDQDVVVYCRSGNRSQQGRDILQAAGFENVTSLSGGINTWIDAGFETMSGP